MCLEVTIVLDRGSITGTIGRGREPNEALRDTWDGQERLELTGPLELKRLFACEESPFGPPMDSLLGLVTRLFLRFCPCVPELAIVVSSEILGFRPEEKVGFEHGFRLSETATVLSSCMLLLFLVSLPRCCVSIVLGGVSRDVMPRLCRCCKRGEPGEGLRVGEQLVIFLTGSLGLFS